MVRHVLARISSSLGSVSGSGTSGIAIWCEKPSSALWKDALIEKIASPCWMATTLRVVKLPPSRMRSTLKMIGTFGSPPSRK